VKVEKQQLTGVKKPPIALGRTFAPSLEKREKAIVSGRWDVDMYRGAGGSSPREERSLTARWGGDRRRLKQRRSRRQVGRDKRKKRWQPLLHNRTTGTKDEMFGDETIEGKDRELEKMLTTEKKKNEIAGKKKKEGVGPRPFPSKNRSGIEAVPFPHGGRSVYEGGGVNRLAEVIRCGRVSMPED